MESITGFGFSGSRDGDAAEVAAGAALQLTVVELGTGVLELEEVTRGD